MQEKSVQDTASHGIFNLSFTLTFWAKPEKKSLYRKKHICLPSTSKLDWVLESPTLSIQSQTHSILQFQIHVGAFVRCKLIDHLIPIPIIEYIQCQSSQCLTQWPNGSLTLHLLDGRQYPAAWQTTAVHEPCREHYLALVQALFSELARRLNNRWCLTARERGCVGVRGDEAPTKETRRPTQRNASGRAGGRRRLSPQLATRIERFLWVDLKTNLEEDLSRWKLSA